MLNSAGCVWVWRLWGYKWGAEPEGNRMIALEVNLTIPHYPFDSDLSPGSLLRGGSCMKFLFLMNYRALHVQALVYAAAQPHPNSPGWFPRSDTFNVRSAPGTYSKPRASEAPRRRIDPSQSKTSHEKHYTKGFTRTHKTKPLQTFLPSYCHRASFRKGSKRLWSV